MKGDIELPTKEILERRKLDAERKKIEAEAAENEKPFFKKKEFYTAILPIVFGLFGLIFSWASGYFDVKLERLEIEEKKLEAAIKKLRADSIKLYDDFEMKNSELNRNYSAKSDSLKKKFDFEVEIILKERIVSEQALHEKIEQLQKSRPGKK